MVGPTQRPEERFAGDALVEYFGGRERCSVAPGRDPPDLELTLCGEVVGIEVSQLVQPTIAPDGSLGSRIGQDDAGLRLLDRLDEALGPSVPESIELGVTFELPIAKPKRFESELAAWLMELLAAGPPAGEAKRAVLGTAVRVCAHTRRPGCRRKKRIWGVLGSGNTSADIALNAQLVLEQRISAKQRACAAVPDPLWLALLNDYWLADAETYALAARQIDVEHRFARILLIDGQGRVSELETCSTPASQAPSKPAPP